MSDPDQPSFNNETSQFLRIPLNRIGSLIGLKGANKDRIEGKTETIIIIDSETGEVEIRPNDKLRDPVHLFKSRDMVKAIGRGFTIDQAIKLAGDDYYLDVIRLKQHIKDKPNHFKRIRARLIGTKGKTRKSLEELIKVHIMILGSTVSIIGTYDKMIRAREAIMEIINGAQIESILGKLEDARKIAKKEEEKLWESEEDVELDDRKEIIEDPFADYPVEQ
jgi:ribosomal RNA assembly protein